MDDNRFKLDCIYFKGDIPCKYNRICEECDYYTSMKERILIIKLASIGDVLRTTPILRALKKKFKQSYITWVTSAKSYQILKGNKFIDEILVYNLETLSRMQVESFDLVICLDKAKQACSLASLVKGKKKVGYGLSDTGKIFPFNKEAEYEFSLGLSNELKFKRNKKTYQEMIFNIIDCEFKGEEYVLPFSDEQKKFSEVFLNRNNLTSQHFKIGLNIGCGDVFPNKKWTVGGFSKLASKLAKEKGAKVLLLAGPEEKSRYKEILDKLDVSLIETGYNNSLKEFIALINCCDLVVSGDTLAMHIALALKKKVVVLFGPTCAQEVELYGRGIKIVSQVECSPCYKNYCNITPNCMDNIGVNQVYEAIYKLKK